MNDVDVTRTVGRTPLVALRRIGRDTGARIYAKLESRNPSGSVKDRVALALIEEAERNGQLTPGATIVEATSGNTGIGLAFIAAARGYRLVLTMPELMSQERQRLLRFLGVEVVLTSGSLMSEAVARAAQLVSERPGAVRLDQFRSEANPRAHYETTGPELWQDTDGKLDILVAGVGTGGTITGAGAYLKEKRPDVKIIAVEPEKAAVLSGQKPRNHLIQGIGAGFIPPLLRRALVDEVIAVSEDDAFAGSRDLARHEGIGGGPSSGAALAAALRVARRPESAGKNIVFVVCDTVERYATTPLLDALATTGR